MKSLNYWICLLIVCSNSCIKYIYSVSRGFNSVYTKHESLNHQEFSLCFKDISFYKYEPSNFFFIISIK